MIMVQDNINIKIFDGINNQEAGTHIDSKQCVTGENILINKPYGTLKKANGFQKYNTTGMYNPIMAILQLKKHRYGNTTGGSFSQTLFTLTGSRIIWGELQDYDYWFDYWYSYTSGWTHNSNTLETPIYGTGGCTYDPETNLFFTKSYGTGGQLYYGSLSATGGLSSITGSISPSSGYVPRIFFNYEQDLIVTHDTNNNGFFKYKYSTGELLGSYILTAGSGVGQGNATDLYYDFDSEYAYITDDTNDRLIKTKLDGSWTDWQALYSYAGKSCTGLHYDKYNDHCYLNIYPYSVDATNYALIRKIDSTGTLLESFTTQFLGQSLGLIRDVFFDNANNMFYFLNNAGATLIKTNFVNYYTSTAINIGGASAFRLFCDPKTRWAFISLYTYDSYKNIKKLNMDTL